MKRVLGILAVVLLTTMLPGQSIAGPYEDCILQNMRGVQAQAAAIAISRACAEKTTPMRCRDAQIEQRLPTVSAGHFLDGLPDATTTKQAAKGKPQVKEFTGVLDDFSRFGSPVPPSKSELISAERAACLQFCESASMWSRNFGECKTD